MTTAEKLQAIHLTVSDCTRCVDLIGSSQNIPRSGFPPGDAYRAIVVGAEPGQAATGKPTPEAYRDMFSPGARNRNKARQIFQDLDEAGINWKHFFYTNAVKCPATKEQAKSCFTHCSSYLDAQINAVHPDLIIVMGTAAVYLGLPKAGAETIETATYRGCPALITRHPQGATRDYRARVVEAIRDRMGL